MDVVYSCRVSMTKNDVFKENINRALRRPGRQLPSNPARHMSLKCSTEPLFCLSQFPRYDDKNSDRLADDEENEERKIEGKEEKSLI